MSTFDLLRFERLQQSLFPPSLKNTACVLWIGKNYRLQDIQLSKNPVNLSVDVAATHGSHKLSSRSCASSALHDLANSSASTIALRATVDILRQRLPGSPSEAARAASDSRRMVENTGLEPVTSWLQTRRSPS
jgi:hypothetical protein